MIGCFGLIPNCYSNCSSIRKFLIIPGSVVNHNENLSQIKFPQNISTKVWHLSFKVRQYFGKMRSLICFLIEHLRIRLLLPRNSTPVEFFSPPLKYLIFHLAATMKSDCTWHFPQVFCICFQKIFWPQFGLKFSLIVPNYQQAIFCLKSFSSLSCHFYRQLSR